MEIETSISKLRRPAGKRLFLCPLTLEEETLLTRYLCKDGFVAPFAEAWPGFVCLSRQMHFRPGSRTTVLREAGQRRRRSRP